MNACLALDFVGIAVPMGYGTEVKSRELLFRWKSENCSLPKSSCAIFETSEGLYSVLGAFGGILIGLMLSVTL